MKKYIVLWTILVIGLFSLLTVFGFKYKKIIKYKKMEESMILVAKEYVKNNNIIIKNQKEIKLTTLLDYNIDLQDKVVEDKCDGKVIIKKGKFRDNYKAKIVCKNYQT